jgi:hypothetical protein
LFVLFAPRSCSYSFTVFGGHDAAVVPGATVGNVDPATGIQCHHIELIGHFVV